MNFKQTQRVGASVARHSLLVAGFSAAIGVGLSRPAYSGAVIFNSPDPAFQTVALGVNDLGHLNFSTSVFRPTNASAAGLASLFPDGTWRDATAPGCLCEGWGLAATTSGSRISGYANQAIGTSGLTLESFSSTTTTALSNVSLSSASGVKVTHDYGVSSVGGMFKGKVTIANTSSDAISDIVYRRVMDWDVPPTEFREFVSHYGVTGNLESAGGNVRFASDNGFASSNPISAAGSIIPSSINSDFIDLGPSDHGSVFDFAFGDLGAGKSREFDIFYGAFDNEESALSALPSLALNLWSFGQSSAGGSAQNDGTTYVFGFRGVGSFVPLPPGGPVSSVPGPLPLFGMGAGFGMSRVLRRRIKAAKVGA
jgi:hypothetical protein